MAEIQRILFSPHLDIGRGIKLLRIEGFDLAGGPFLRYAKDGEEANLRVCIQESIIRGKGMRIILFDHLENPEDDKKIRDKLPWLDTLLTWIYAKNQPTKNKKSRV